MNILFDENIPAPLRHHLTGHSVDTVQARGWHGMRNGLLLDQAEVDGYDLLITADQSIRFQQTLAGRELAILVLSSNSWARIKYAAGDILAAIADMDVGMVKELPIRPEPQ